MHDGGLRGKRGVSRTKAGIQHIGHRIDGKLLPKGRACDFRVLLNPFELAGVKANRRRTGCNLNHRIDKMRHVLFGNVAGTVSVTATNKARNLGEKGNVGIIALMRSRAKLNRPARCGVEQVDFLAQNFGHRRICVFGINGKVRKCHDKASFNRLPSKL